MALKAPKTQLGVSLDIDVVKYLDQVAVSEDRDRSSMINRIVREWAEAKGSPIPIRSLKESKRARASQ
jgi:metal-responsive CopG/Arc/MetJ family transcriptional regulator